MQYTKKTVINKNKLSGGIKKSFFIIRKQRRDLFKTPLVIF